MKRKFINNVVMILILLMIIFFYLLLINLIAQVIYFVGVSNTFEQETHYKEGGGLRLGVSDRVDVSIVRKRWYGTMIESYTKDKKSSFLFLFNIVKLPLYINNFNFLYIHLIFSLIFIFLIVLIKILKGGK